MPSWLPVFVITLVLVALGVLAMGVGVIFRRSCLRGSCGGSGPGTADGMGPSCVSCPNRKRPRTAADG